MESSADPSESIVSSGSDAKIAAIFGLQGEWWIRHANPLSVWSRFSCLSALALSIWSRAWIGGWCLLPLALSVLWLMVNPTLFPRPRSTRSWASKGVLGEKIWSEAATGDLPEQFDSRVPDIANAYSLIGVALLAYGLVRLEPLSVVAGILIVHGGKAWYIDRMALLFEDVKHRNDAYAELEF